MIKKLNFVSQELSIDQNYMIILRKHVISSTMKINSTETSNKK